MRAMIPNTFTQRGVLVVDLRLGFTGVCAMVVSPSILCDVPCTDYGVARMQSIINARDVFICKQRDRIVQKLHARRAAHTRSVRLHICGGWE